MIPPQFASVEFQTAPNDVVMLNVVVGSSVVSQCFRVPEGHRWLHTSLRPGDNNSWRAIIEAEMPDGTRVMCESIPWAGHRHQRSTCYVTAEREGIKLNTRSPKLAAQWSNG